MELDEAFAHAGANLPAAPAMPLPHALAAALPDRAYWLELLRPWKLATFAGSMAVLLYGAMVMGIGDWDVGVTVLMGGLTYALAPWCVRLVDRAVRGSPRMPAWHVGVSLAIAVLVVDTSYLVYHGWAGNPIDRRGNFLASMPLFYLAGVLWSWRGTVRQLLAAVRGALRGPAP
jgi:hypothetical protein